VTFGQGFETFTCLGALVAGAEYGKRTFACKQTLADTGSLSVDLRDWLSSVVVESNNGFRRALIDHQFEERNFVQQATLSKMTGRL
jgi:hypothetical protein